MALIQEQLRAVKWYIGEVTGNDLFWGDPKAYVTLNSLFFPGIRTEQMRASEGKPLNPELLADGERLVAVLQALLSAFSPLTEPLETFRVERYADFAIYRKRGALCSFTSTSTAGFLPAYQDRIGIALMRFHLLPGTPAIRMAEVLEQYEKADEAEVLLPPGLSVRMEECRLTQAEQKILDAKGNPPEIAVRVTPEVPERGQAIPALPLPPAESGMRVLQAVASGKTPEHDDVIRYNAWKIQLADRAAAFLCP